MDHTDQHSAYGLATGPLKNKPQGRASKATPPVRISFQNTPSKQPTNGRNNVRISQTDSGFKKGDFELALKRTEKKGNRFYKDEEMGMLTDVEHFKVYGPGISLFFQFQKSLINVFLMMSVIALVPLLYNIFCGTVMGSKGSSVNYWIGATTIGNYNSNDSAYENSFKYMNVIPDMVSMLTFSIFYFYWLHKGEVIIEQIRSEVKLKSYFVLELTDFSANASAPEVQQFMSQFGPVVQVAPVRNYSQTISLSKKIFDLQIELKQLQLKKSEENSNEYNQEIKEIQDKIDDIYKELVLYEDDTRDEVIQYYVAFGNIEDRENALRQLKQHESHFFDCCDSKTPENYLLCGEKVCVRACHTEPADIIWENQHVTWSTRWLRVLIQYILLLAGIGVGFVGISFLNILVPSSSSSVDTSSYTSTSIQSVSNSTIVQSWCIENHVSVLQAGSSSAIYSYCWDYIFKYYLQIATKIGIAISICLLKFVLKHFVMFLAKFKRYKTHTEQSKDMIQNLFFVYVSTTVLVTLLLQANVLNISFKSLIAYFVSGSYLETNVNSLVQYSDFESNWYVEIGYQIIFNALILVFHPNFTMPFFYCVMEKLSHCLARKQEVQAKMEKKLELPEFQIESDYAQIMTLVFMGLAFSGGMPVITIFCFLSLFLRYFFQKFYFFRYCKIPKMFDQALDTQVSSLLPYAIIIHFCLSIWMFGNSDIFEADAFTFSEITANSTNSFVISMGFILQRIFATWYYSAFLMLFLLVWLFKQIIFNFFVKVFVSSGESRKIIPVNMDFKQQSGTGFVSFVSSKSLCDSYKIEHNPDYVQVLEIMKRKRKFIVKVKNVPNPG